MQLNVVKTGDIDRKLNILVYGQAGTGKTSFGGTGEPRFKTIIANAEGGTLSLNEKARQLGISGYDTYPIKSIDDLGHLRDYLYNAQHQYKLVVLDSGTEIQKVCMEAILKQNKREHAEIRDWGTLNDKMVAIIRAFRDLPKVSVVMTALEDTETLSDTGETRIIPSFQGKISRTIDGYFDEVFYAFTKEKELEGGKKEIIHRFLTRNNGRIRGKDRSGKLPVVVEPDFCKIYDLIFPEEKK